MTALMESKDATRALVLAMLDTLEEAQDGGDPEQAAAEVKAMAALARNPEVLMRALGASDVIREAEACDNPTERGEGVPLVEAGFTGMKRDSLGRKMYFQDGNHVTAPDKDTLRHIKQVVRNRMTRKAAKRLAQAHVAGHLDPKIIQRLKGVLQASEDALANPHETAKHLAADAFTRMSSFAKAEFDHLPVEHKEAANRVMRWLQKAGRTKVAKAIKKAVRTLAQIGTAQALPFVFGTAGDDAMRTTDAYAGIKANQQYQFNTMIANAVGDRVGVHVPAMVAGLALKGAVVGIKYGSKKGIEAHRRRKARKAELANAKADQPTTESVESTGADGADLRSVAEYNRVVLVAALEAFGIKDAESLVPSVDEMYQNMVEGEDGGV